MTNRPVIKLIAIPVLLALLVPSVAAAPRLPYNDAEKAWLEQVAPIITAKERRAFRQKMTTHEARAQYIEIFWAKRDPDLGTPVNEFKEAYLERLAYAEANFDKHDARIPSLSMYQLYLMLGEPDRKSYWLDPVMFSTSTFRYRGYRTHPPELWEYKDPGYGFARNTLKVQFIATSSFGDYVAYTDSYYTEHFLDNLKHKLIVNPEIEVLPVAGSMAGFRRS